MSQENCYELFRNEITTDLLEILDDQSILIRVVQAIDVRLSAYELVEKITDIIPYGTAPELVKMFIASKAVANIKKSTLRQYTYKLQNLCSVINKPIDKIEANDIRMYLFNYKMNKNASDRYIESIRTTISGFFEWLFHNKYINVNPCEMIEKVRYTEKQRQPLTMYQLEKIRWNCKGTRERALVEFLYSTGCRVSECVDVLESDINFNNRSVYIRNGKGGKPRTVFFSASSEFTMKKYMQERVSKDGTLFCSTRDPYGRVKTHSVENVLRKIGNRAGIDLYPHRLRHTFATHALHAGMPLERLQALMGHSSPKTTMIYAKIDITDLQNEHQKAYA